MTVHPRLTPFLAVIGALALGGASVARAQETTNAPPKDTSAAAQSDTSGYGSYQNRTDTTQVGQANTRTDSSGFKYTGPATDTTLKAKPGAQTGPTAGDSGNAAGKATAAADTVACKDGSNAAKAKQACAEHGGVDWAATRAAMKARGKTLQPGTQTGADTGAAGKSDSVPGSNQNP